MIRQERKSLRVLVSRNVKVEKSGPGWSSVSNIPTPDGSKVGDVTVEIDIEAIFRVMGGKALRSRSVKCVDGFVTVRARNVKHEK